MVTLFKILNKLFKTWIALLCLFTMVGLFFVGYYKSSTDLLAWSITCIVLIFLSFILRKWLIWLLK